MFRTFGGVVPDEEQIASRRNAGDANGRGWRIQGKGLRLAPTQPRIRRKTPEHFTQVAADHHQDPAILQLHDSGLIDATRSLWDVDFGTGLPTPAFIIRTKHNPSRVVT